MPKDKANSKDTVVFSVSIVPNSLQKIFIL